MTYFAIILNAYQALRHNTRRSILTMIGIIIGIASVITILALGRGFETYTVQNLTASAEKNVSVDIAFQPSEYEQFKAGKMPYFTDEDLTLASQVEGVEKVTYAKEDDTFLSVDLVNNQKKVTKTVAFAKDNQEVVDFGRTISREENDTYQKVVMISFETAKEINSDVKKVLGTGIDIKGELYQVIGIYKGGTTSLFDATSDIKIPKKTYRYYANAARNPMQIKVTVANDYKPSSIAKQVIKKLGRLGINRNFGEYTTFDMRAVTDGIGKVLKMLTYFISGIAGISLFIAGVGVMNMMYTSVSERTQEIGVRRSVGAEKSDIRNQFLVEGLMLTISAGAIGYILGYLIALVISLLLPFKVSPDLFTISLTLVITILIGLVFSITPANLAARKELVEILR
ncbi:FtsX-like permease family protein [Lactococcus piscium]|uniref:ABC transporter permease n=1 Tax=Pseudolactococcus carnosus TaxID=2749961 RepID=UPI001FBB17A4|nr:ABC transporter permease [Lactococcus carnosus]MCJ1995956.1 FtsX-like permease family protein [Lactococcus carnosus]